MIGRRVSSGLNRIRKYPFNFKLSLPQKLKGGRIEKWADYWIHVGTDYKEAIREIIKDSKDNPFKASVYIAGICAICYAIRENPNMNDYQDSLQRYMNESALVGDKLRSPEVDNHFNYLVNCFNHEQVRRLSFGVGSIIWIDNYSKECGLYKAQCSYLKPRYLTFYERIVDVGFFNTWWNIYNKHKVFDINEEEWTQSEKIVSDDSRER